MRLAQAAETTRASDNRTACKERVRCVMPPIVPQAAPCDYVQRRGVAYSFAPIRRRPTAAAMPSVPKRSRYIRA